MESMYKVRGFRLTLLAGAVLCATMAVTLDLGAVQPLLWITALWLLATAALLQHRLYWPARMPWQLLPSLLLASLLTLDPDSFGVWMWAFAILMMLPQPRWMMALNVTLAAFAWWQVAATLPRAEANISGAALALLMLAGAAHAVQLRPLWQRVSQRQRLIPGLRLWSAQRLEESLARERTRSERDPLHGELLLVRSAGYRCWRLAQRLAEASHSFEHCYRLDRRTLAITLVGRDPAAVRQRCQALLSMLPQRDLRARTLPLSDSERLEEAREALAEQKAPLVHDEACP